MNAEVGRTQTTLGVWLGLSGGNGTDAKSILVLDVEGTDSRERGEDHGAFERKTSLFSLALSEILIINMWTNDVGRFEGANYSLLKIVFEMNLRLFASGGASKTLLFFIFRDHNPVTPLTKISKVIADDMAKLWKDMPKPDQYSNSSVSDFFDFRFTSLPHKILEDQFIEGVEKLKDTFMNPANPEPVFSQKYKSGVPSDGFAKYASNIWTTIQEEKDLNLPSQKQMLATYRCSEILNEEFNAFSSMVNSKFIEPLENGESLPTFGKDASEAIQASLEAYDKLSSRYEEEVRAMKKRELVEKINFLLKSVFSTLLKAALDTCKAHFNEELSARLPPSEPSLKFVSIAAEVKDETVAKFQELAMAAVVPDFSSEWTFAKEAAKFVAEIEVRLSEEREGQLQLFIANLRSKMESDLSTRLSKPCEKAEPTMWASIRSIFNGVTERATGDYSEVLDAFEVEPEKRDSLVADLAAQAEIALKLVLNKKTSNLKRVLGRIFKQSFELDANDVPRRWTVGDNVSSEWALSKLKAEKILDLFCLLRLDEEDDELHFFGENSVGVVVVVDDLPVVSSEKVIISLEQGKEILADFRDMATPAFHAAIKEQEHAAAFGKTPWYFYAIIGLLGWNEAVWFINVVLFNPVWLIFTILVGAGLYVVWKFNLHPIIFATVGPAMHATSEMIQSHLQDFLQQAQAAQQPNVAAGRPKQD
eukprot:TRINITY_DN162_c9_g1_i1.p1 TRINITY_DN162_c9_g1~~TRINITY_DN162_c9_g1_i1.p1  ORF type:complete len:782 (+),score=223.82 TRINITY_DN162_c9_g1_i1:237-2348(+)